MDANLADSAGWPAGFGFLTERCLRSVYIAGGGNGVKICVLLSRGTDDVSERAQARGTHQEVLDPGRREGRMGSPRRAGRPGAEAGELYRLAPGRAGAQHVPPANRRAR